MLPRDFNYRSTDWALIRAELQKRLDSAVGQLCGINCSPTEADQLRGRIAFIKEMLASETAALKDRLNGGN